MFLGSKLQCKQLKWCGNLTSPIFCCRVAFPAASRGLSPSARRCCHKQAEMLWRRLRSSSLIPRPSLAMVVSRRQRRRATFTELSRSPRLSLRQRVPVYMFEFLVQNAWDSCSRPVGNGFVVRSWEDGWLNFGWFRFCNRLCSKLSHPLVYCESVAWSCSIIPSNSCIQGSTETTLCIRLQLSAGAPRQPGASSH